METHDVVVIGGGAAGFFGAIRYAECCRENGQVANVMLAEKTEKLLAKVLVSGGGRCNVTHACFDPQQLSGFYPRGGSALRGAFTRFQPKDTVQWFKDRGVELKTEKDGRMFPVTNRSTTIADCLLKAAEKSGVTVRTRLSLAGFSLEQGAEYPLRLTFQDHSVADTVQVQAKALLVASGGTKAMHELLTRNGVSMVPDVPSLFTFVVNDERIEGIPGLSVDQAAVTFCEPDRQYPVPAQTGAILVTHWGLSGPGILRLSAWGARRLAARQYRDRIRINWVQPKNADDVFDVLAKIRKDAVYGRKTALANPAFSQISGRMWRKFISACGVSENARWTDLNNHDLRRIAESLTGMEFVVEGKGVYKDEFVTAGGVDLGQVNFRDMQSRQLPGVFFAGEVLDVDGVTGGFNFQNAWTTAWIAGGGMHERVFGAG